MTGESSTSAPTFWKNGSAKGGQSEGSGMSNTMNAVRWPSNVVKYMASGCQRSSAPCITFRRLPSRTALFPSSVDIVIFAITRICPPPDAHQLEIAAEQRCSHASHGAAPTTPRPRWRDGSASPQRRLAWVRHSHLGDGRPEITLVVGEKPIGATTDGGRQVSRVGCAQSVLDRQGRSELGRGPVDGAQVEACEQPGEHANLAGCAVA